jgi:SOS-response transcriptional repressor LexA
MICAAASTPHVKYRSPTIGGIAHSPLEWSERMSKNDTLETFLREMREWVNHHIARKKVSLNQLARATDIGVATLYRIVEKEGSTVPSLPTIYALERFFEDKAPVFGGEIEYLSKDEAMPIPEGNAPHFSLIDGLSLWKITSDALEILGIYKGDLMVVDMNRKPTHDQIVLAEIKDWDRAEPYMIFRRYIAEPLPMLLAATAKTDIPNQFLMDGRSTAVVGVVVGSYKQLLSA